MKKGGKLKKVNNNWLNWRKLYKKIKKIERLNDRSIMNGVVIIIIIKRRVIKKGIKNIEIKINLKRDGKV